MSDLLLKKEDGIGTIMLNRPDKKNSFTIEMIEQWAAILEKWRTDPEVSVIVLTGAGEDFCAGADFSTIGGGPLQAGAYEMKQFLWDKVHRIPLTLEDIDKPVIAAMKGVAVAAGLDMALMCDIRFASETARFSEGYVKLGLVPGDGGAYFLPRLVGMGKALEILWTGDFVDAQEALRIGLVNRVYPDDRLMDETYKFARRLADGPGAALRMIKRATYQSSRTDLRTSLDLISSHLGLIRETSDSRNALRRALSKHSKNDKQK
jgi:enoyl-CoA hydratase/carnithine racemase